MFYILTSMRAVSGVVWFEDARRIRSALNRLRDYIPDHGTGWGPHASSLMTNA